MEDNYQNSSNFYNNYDNQEANGIVNGENSIDNNDGNYNNGNNNNNYDDSQNDTNSQTDNDNITEPEQFRKVFIGGLSYKTDDETLKNYFAKYGKLVDYVVMKDGQSGRSRGFGFVTYSHSFMVDELMKNRPHIIDGRQVEPKRATPREDSGKAEVQMTVKKLFIGGLRENITEDDLKNYFSQYGSVLEVVIMKEKDSTKSRGFGFVTFDDYDPIDKIILEKHHTINGVNIHTQKALPKDFDKGQNKPHGGSRNSNQQNKSDYYSQNNNNSGNNQNPSMQNFNNFAQMAASFFAAATANKMNPNSNSNTQNRSMYGNYGYNNYPNNNTNGVSASTTTANNTNSGMNYPMNPGSNSSNKMGNMPYGMNNPNSMTSFMNQFMNPAGPMGNMMSSMSSSSGMNNKMMPNQPGPLKGGQGRFFNRTGGPYASGGNQGKQAARRGGRNRN